MTSEYAQQGSIVWWRPGAVSAGLAELVLCGLGSTPMGLPLTALHLLGGTGVIWRHLSCTMVCRAAYLGRVCQNKDWRSLLLKLRCLAGCKIPTGFEPKRALDVFQGSMLLFVKQRPQQLGHSGEVSRRARISLGSQRWIACAT